MSLCSIAFFRLFDFPSFFVNINYFVSELIDLFSLLSHALLLMLRCGNKLLIDLKTCLLKTNHCEHMAPMEPYLLFCFTQPAIFSHIQYTIVHCPHPKWLKSWIQVALPKLNRVYWQTCRWTNCT